MRKKIQQILDELRLKGMTEALDRELDRAEKNGAPVTQVLHRLLREELKHRRERSMAYRINNAKIPWPWTLQTFPFELQPGVRKHQILSLAELSFVAKAENIVFIGPPGTGKSGLASGLLRQALIEGYRGRLYNAQDLLDEVYASLADQTTPKVVRRLSNYDHPR